MRIERSKTIIGERFFSRTASACALRKPSVNTGKVDISAGSRCAPAYCTHPEHFYRRARFPNITHNRSSKTNYVITTLNDVTPGWVTSVLHQNGIANDTEVSRIQVILSRELPVSTV